MAWGAVDWINADVDVQNWFIAQGYDLGAFRTFLSLHDFKIACQGMGIVDEVLCNQLEERYLTYVASKAPSESKEDASEAQSVHDKRGDELLDPAQFWAWFCSKVANPQDFLSSLSFLGEGAYPTSAVFNQLGSSFGWAPSEVVGYQQEYQIYLQAQKAAYQAKENQSSAPKELVTPADDRPEAVESLTFCEAALGGGEASYFDAISLETQEAHCEHIISVVSSCVRSFAAIDSGVIAVHPGDYSREVYCNSLRSLGTLKTIEVGIAEKLRPSAELAKRIDTARVAHDSWEKYVKNNRRKGSPESLRLFQGRKPAAICSLS